MGAGGVHHVAFRTPDEATYQGWIDRLRSLRVPSSGPVDRYYFRSLYFREPHGILFEIATDGPGFATDEPADSLGERLALPPFLEPRRAKSRPTSSRCNIVTTTPPPRPGRLPPRQSSDYT
jgi:glyoxalase family protein